jgi:hypothetical protein
LLGGIASLGLWRARPAVRPFVVLAFAGVLLSLGPEIHLGSATVSGPFDLMRVLPGFGSLRTPSRAFPLVALGLGCSAAVFISWICGAARWCAAPVILLALSETIPKPLGRELRAIEQPPAYAFWLAKAPRGPLLELPNRDSGLYLYWSTVHWQPLVNGWGAYAPRGHSVLPGVARRFPLPGAVGILRSAGVRYVAVHTDRMVQKRAKRLGAPLPPGVTVVFQDGPHRLYRLDPPGARPGRKSSVGSAPDPGVARSRDRDPGCPLLRTRI